ncbi:BPSS1187 family protein [Glaciecola petra]|uniref:Phospholipase/carboxylesterase/thioesterase domain-containing protein n=1 Tax=Glaciecola petra TaxID=3075602 RepID=A0ABU2ZSE9_9ALTE|nr:hypothetical protein [Aestuariibacter sp. P117]MDT0595239.1 hypothetical protein [Aestuariibacter sp. P117]
MLKPEKRINLFNVVCILFCIIIGFSHAKTSAETIEVQPSTILANNIHQIMIKPSATDASITKADVPHLVWYQAESPAEKFRTQRVFGTQLLPLIPDQPQDAIINRFEKLLSYLIQFDKKGHWDKFLVNGRINWKKIIVAGQSQGGGMAAFIAKKIVVNKIITFSGGWDFSARPAIANWYHNESVTPAKDWFGVYHSQEPMADIINNTYNAMAIPEEHIYRLKEKVRDGKKAHGEGIRNTVYKNLWVSFLSD